MHFTSLIGLNYYSALFENIPFILLQKQSVVQNYPSRAVRPDAGRLGRSTMGLTTRFTQCTTVQRLHNPSSTPSTHCQGLQTAIIKLSGWLFYKVLASNVGGPGSIPGQDRDGQHRPLKPHLGIGPFLAALPAARGRPPASAPAAASSDSCH